MPGKLLKVENLHLVTVNGPIVKEFSFDIKQGEILALTGKSGSGKTSIAHAILDVLPAGVIRTNGRFTFFKSESEHIEFPSDIHAWHALRGSGIGFIQQDVFGAFDPVLKIGQQMLMIVGERSNQKRSFEAELKNILSEVGLDDINRIWNSYPHQLSGGQLQRCLLAFSIVLKPALLIADEPTSAIDKVNQIELLDLFDFIRNKYGIAILCITHEPAVIRYIADREISVDRNVDKKTLQQDLINNNKPSDEAILEVKSITYTHKFGGLKASAGATLNDISFNLSKGRCTAIIGSSGSGKSTLAQILVGLFIPTDGQLIMEGTRIDFHDDQDIYDLRSKIQLVMQDGKGSLYPNKMIRELLREVVKFRSGSSYGNDEEILIALHEVGLREGILTMRARSLSGGECLRISIARALLMRPAILICDESTSALDESTKADIIDLLQSLIITKELAVIFISHDEYVTRRLAHEILVLSDGRIVDRGSYQSLSTSENPVTQRLFLSQATLAQKKSL